MGRAREQGAGIEGRRWEVQRLPVLDVEVRSGLAPKCCASIILAIGHEQ